MLTAGYLAFHCNVVFPSVSDVYGKLHVLVVFLRQMKNDFKRMEDEMDHLAANMAEITEFSARISDTLQDRRQQITQLSGVHTLLKKVALCVCAISRIPPDLGKSLNFNVANAKSRP